MSWLSGCCRGLSPRVRGKQATSRMGAAPKRSIPACAGEAPSRPSASMVNAVYPRVCGGSPRFDTPALPKGGLSPRVRGKRLGVRALEFHRRSIPACAGEAPGNWNRETASQVYPRVCGGSNGGRTSACAAPGLSPRVRGKQGGATMNVEVRRSIPACAGEASLLLRGHTEAEVYPRVCGGSGMARPSALPARGLSPRVRGKHNPLHHARLLDRSIPACAGEAARWPTPTTGPAVYPRVCGGSGPSTGATFCGYGLSPRVRGKRIAAITPPPAAGSIPACAGEAPARGQPFAAAGVYPRVCGGSRSRRRAI